MVESLGSSAATEAIKAATMSANANLNDPGIHVPSFKVETTRQQFHGFRFH